MDHFEQFALSTILKKQSQNHPTPIPNCPKRFPKHSQTCPKKMKQTPKTTHIQNVFKKCPKRVRKVSQTCPKIFQNVSKKHEKTTLGRARNRTRYPPDPTPAPVRGPAHWANLVTTKRVSRDFLCIKIREALCFCGICPQGLFPSQKSHFSEKQALCFCGICPQGLFFLRKSDFSEKQALCFCGTCPQGHFYKAALENENNKGFHSCKLAKKTKTSGPPKLVS